MKVAFLNKPDPEIYAQALGHVLTARTGEKHICAVKKKKKNDNNAKNTEGEMKWT